MKTLSISIPTLILSFIISCDAFYRISLSKSNQDISINTTCGHINISLLNWQGHSFDFYQDFNLKDTLTIYKDSLYIYYKDRRYFTTFIRKGKGILSDKKVELIGNESLRTAFYIEHKVNKGDTIQVYPRGYLYCKEKEVKLDDIEIIIQQDLRGPFEK